MFLYTPGLGVDYCILDLALNSERGAFQRVISLLSWEAVQLGFSVHFPIVSSSSPEALVVD